ncbi:circadian locomoter output cycles protein kaput isoform X2 [Prorops nasuta]|uniref:circadian locomoter output cycles protein kaput isoform X2 n=1 Tax=Prorops nasuta TaxID=863751 RepID=UPI0034CFDD0F
MVNLIIFLIKVAMRSRVHEIQEDWKPSFLSNEEFTHLILEALDGFIIVLSCNGCIHYVSESVTSLLGYLPSELENTTIYDIANQEDQSHLYNILLNPGNNRDRRSIKKEEQLFFTCHIKRGGLDFREDPIYELVQFIGYFRTDVDTDIDNLITNTRLSNSSGSDTKLIFVGTGRLQTPQLIREMSVIDSTKSEFTSRHSLEWKFLFLDHRAPPIIGYLPFEVLGTSGYDYYHVDDLDKVVTCHESLMQKGEGTSCHYRFLTKGQQWIWLQTRFYITYNQWNSKPEFIVCTHHVISYVDVMKEMRKSSENLTKDQTQDVVLMPVKQQQHQISSTPCQTNSQWGTKSSKTKSVTSRSGIRRHEESSNASSMSISMHSSHSQITHGSRSKAASATSSVTSKSVAPIADSQQQHQLEVEEPCINFMESTPYTTLNMQPVVNAEYPPPSNPAINTLPASDILHQQGIVMTSTQNQIQDELQRKHEELQQLIVHQQEELRRVSEQLFIARYGILSPLLNAGIGYNGSNACQPVSRCNSNNSSGMQIQNTGAIQGVNVLPIPLTVPMSIVPTELFPQTLSGNPVQPLTGPVHANVASMIHPQQQSHPAIHQQQTQQTQQTQQDGNHSDLVPFQICSQQQNLIYTNLESTASQQQRPPQN